MSAKGSQGVNGTRFRCWDKVVGKRLLVGITYLNRDGELHFKFILPDQGS
jgi:hypothetical protein